MMIKPFGHRTATTKRSSDGVILSMSGGVHPFPDDVLALLMVPVIFHCRFAGKISLLGARWECSPGTSDLPERSIKRLVFQIFNAI